MIFQWLGGQDFESWGLNHTISLKSVKIPTFPAVSILPNEEIWWDTPPKFDIEPEKWWFPKGISFSRDFCSGSMLDFWGVFRNSGSLVVLHDVFWIDTLQFVQASQIHDNIFTKSLEMWNQSPRATKDWGQQNGRDNQITWQGWYVWAKQP